MKNIRKIVESYGLNKDLSELLIKELEEEQFKYWEKQSSEMSRELLKKTILIERLMRKKK